MVTITDDYAGTEDAGADFTVPYDEGSFWLSVGNLSVHLCPSKDGLLIEVTPQQGEADCRDLGNLFVRWEDAEEQMLETFGKDIPDEWKDVPQPHKENWED